MNLRGSYRKLFANSKAAMLASIEMYNKPQIEYRDEIFTILLINSWELLAKAILSKNKQRIYYKKGRNEEYKTFSLTDAMRKAKHYFPAETHYEPIAENIKAIQYFRDNAIHFYNQQGFGVLMYGLAQTSIINYRDIVKEIFDVNLADEMTLHLLPLAFGIPPDPIEFLQSTTSKLPKNKVAGKFLKRFQA